MKTIKISVVSISLLLLSQSACQADTHKYWVCGVATYQSTVGGVIKQGECRANTAYSETPCREFVVEYDGTEGVNPDKPYQQTINSTTTKIEIKPNNQHHSYQHSISKGNDQWHYNGKCSYFEAPKSEKIYMDKGLNTGQ